MSLSLVDTSNLITVTSIDADGNEITTVNYDYLEDATLITIPDNATNRDMIKAMFPNAKFDNAKGGRRMTKEELIRGLKYTKEKHKNDRINTLGINITLMCEDTLKVLDNCIEIPEAATNGDVIKALFSNVTHFDKEWWNAPYKD